jgi:hypothetical protein
MTRRIARIIILGGLAAAAGCASGSGLPRRVPGSNVTLPVSTTDIVRDLLLGCESSRDRGAVGQREACGSVTAGTRTVPGVPVSPP